jgi:Flp pilus assembly protein TadD
MNRRLAMSFTLSALLLGGTMVGCTHDTRIASASARDADKAESQAADLAAKAGKALADKKGDKAVDYAEAAVTLQPRDASYRVLLGQSYLEAGRFASAHQAFVDTLALDPDNARAALNLALAQTAEGNWAGARQTLADHAAIIPASDRGLALALAGDPKGAVAILLPAARTPGADSKTRQNLALAFALAGDWRDARVIVSMDLSPADVDKRLGQWAQLAQPRRASDQVAALLGVTPSQDPGQPIALALNAPATPIAFAEASPIPLPAPAVEPAAPLAAPAPAAAAPRVASIVFGPRHEVVQPLPVETHSVRTPVIEQAAIKSAPHPLSSGSYYVQLGAYENAAVARDGWARAKRRLPMLADQTPQGMHFSQDGSDYYRLSVGGFAKADARRLCSHYRARGGKCFIRIDAGDALAQWVKKGTEFASR